MCADKIDCIGCGQRCWAGEELEDDEFVCFCCEKVFDIEDSFKCDDELFCPRCVKGLKKYFIMG